MKTHLPIYFGIKKSNVKATSRKNIAGVGLCTLVSVDLFWLQQPLFSVLSYSVCC